MKRITYIFFLVFLLYINLSGQNLVKNPSFESYDICPDTGELFNGYVKNWHTFFSTPDYLNTCDFYPNYVTDGILPHTGDAVAGCRWFIGNSPATGREYIQGEFTSPLVANEWYYFEFYSHVLWYAVAIDAYQVHFSTTLIMNTPNDGILNLEPHISNENGVITTYGWVKTSGCYQATGGEQYAILGNFLSEETTDTMKLFDAAQRHYALIDDVGMYALNSLVPNDTSIIEGASIVFPNTVDEQYYYESELLEGGIFSNPPVGLHTIEVYLSPCGLIDSFEVEVLSCQEASLANTAILRDTSFCVEDNWSIFIPMDTYFNYYWEDNLLNGSNFEALDTGLYNIQYQNPNCPWMNTITLNSIECDTIQVPTAGHNDCFYFPNVFSPNDDGINDTFGLYGPCPIVSYQMNIYDRWGNHIFTSDDYSNGWKGNWKGEKLNPGVFVYVCVFSYYNTSGQLITAQKAGGVTLVR